VLDRANIPARKSGPHRSLIVLLGFFLSFVLSCSAILVHNSWHRMDKDSEFKKLLTDIFTKLRLHP
jgi:uncharacterized protein involved in exopolysaccharide biosynthesis